MPRDSHFDALSPHNLGVRLDSFSIVDDPPPDHPLAHLCIAEAYTYETLGKAKININAISAEHLSTTINRLPLLQYLTMPTVANKRRDPYSTEWREVFKIHRLRGLKWLDETGEPINALQHQEVRRNGWWEASAHLAFLTVYVIFILFVDFPRI